MNAPLLPWRDVGLDWGHGLFPIKRPRTRIWPISRILGETFPDRVVEDVPCYSIVVIILPENVVVESSLPKFPYAKAASPCRRDALEIVKKLNRVRVVRLSSQFKVHVVWHETVGVQVE